MSTRLQFSNRKKVMPWKLNLLNCMQKKNVIGIDRDLLPLNPLFQVDLIFVEIEMFFF
jgi:hypothetical protein